MTLNAIDENRLLGVWRNMRRSPAQLNALHEADAELVPIGNDQILATTIDTVDEEIAAGLYPDAETAGWVAAAASLSDLAAVGATPVGLVASVLAPAPDTAAWLAGVARGLDGAAAEAGTYVLGGDTGRAAGASSVTVCAQGLVARESVLARVGMLPGDELYASAPLGDGAVWAAQQLLRLPLGVEAFRPSCRAPFCSSVRTHLSAAMDTSDGLIATLDQLARINEVGVDLMAPLGAVLSPAALKLSQGAGVSPLTLLAVFHGEFELVVAVPRRHRDAFEAASGNQGHRPVYLGHVRSEPGVSADGRALDTAAIRNASAIAAVDPAAYLQALTALTTS